MVGRMVRGLGSRNTLVVHAGAELNLHVVSSITVIKNCGPALATDLAKDQGETSHLQILQVDIIK